MSSGKPCGRVFPRVDVPDLRVIRLSAKSSTFMRRRPGVVCEELNTCHRGGRYSARPCRAAASSRAPSTYVSRTNVSCVWPQCEHRIVSFVDHEARRLATSVSMPVGTFRWVIGQVNSSSAMCVSFEARARLQLKHERDFSSRRRQAREPCIRRRRFSSIRNSGIRTCAGRGQVHQARYVPAASSCRIPDTAAE